jgi:hypothetical protein
MKPFLLTRIGLLAAVSSGGTDPEPEPTPADLVFQGDYAAPAGDGVILTFNQPEPEPPAYGETDIVIPSTAYTPPSGDNVDIIIGS